jgi:hypothetical protein
MSDSYPDLVSDPAADGIPEYADDDSTAEPARETGRQADGPSPAQLPADDRDDGPRRVAGYGVTAEEQRRAEPLADRLAREEPDDTDPDRRGDLDTYRDDRPVGRLVAPDQGTGADTEPDAVATDAGTSGGGASAEERAVHEVTETSGGEDTDDRTIDPPA